MTTKSQILLRAVVLSALAWGTLRAADPRPSPTTGRVLILENERVLEGEIDQVGDQYRVRRTVGETWVPANQVLYLCGNLGEAHAYLRTRANLRDPDEHIRLAQWCQLHNLRSQAVEEAAAAVELRPDHPESLRMLRALQRAAATAAATQAAPPADKLEAGPVLPQTLDLGAEALGLFTSRVQPILMNTCASCHASGRGGSFKLTRAYEGALTNRRATQQNLSAVLAQISKDHPQASPFLTRAVSVHGEAEQPPLKGRQTPAFRILEEWVRMTAGDTKMPDAAPAVVALPVTEPKGPVEVSHPLKGEPVSVPSMPPGNKQPGSPAETPLAGPPDPYDPGLFNRQMHPQAGN